MRIRVLLDESNFAELNLDDKPLQEAPAPAVPSLEDIPENQRP